MSWLELFEDSENQDAIHCAWGAVTTGFASGWRDVSYAEFQSLDMRGNDCTKTSSVEFHILGQKCPTCRRQETKLTSPQVETWEKAETLKFGENNFQTTSPKGNCKSVKPESCRSRVGRVFVNELFSASLWFRLKYSFQILPCLYVYYIDISNYTYL